VLCFKCVYSVHRRSINTKKLFSTDYVAQMSKLKYSDGYFCSLPAALLLTNSMKTILIGNSV